MAWDRFGNVPRVPLQHPSAPTTLSPICSFCRRGERQVKKLVTGPGGVNICSECIEIGLDKLDHSPDRLRQVLRLQNLTFEREQPSMDHFAKEGLRPEIDSLVASLRKRRRDGPGDIIANARLIRTVGAGNFSTVWEGRLVDSNNRDTGQVAVKIFDQDKLSLGLMLWRFQRGLRALQHFKNLGKRTPKTIVQLLDVADDHLSFTMPFLRGGDLQSLRTRHLDLERRLTLFQQICHGVAFAHDQGIIHRDIKPANIVLDAGGDAVLTDFDIADISFAQTQSVLAGGLGTPQFAAPEQLLAVDTDAHVTCDIYSLGKMLLFLLTEKAPPVGAIDGAPMPDYLSAIASPKHRQAIHCALQTQPGRRPQSVADLLSLLA